MLSRSKLCGFLLNKVWHGAETHCGQVLCLYFCPLAVKAVHIEAMSDLTSESFIQGVSLPRRGHPSLVWSGFVRAYRELKDLQVFG